MIGNSVFSFDLLRAGDGLAAGRYRVHSSFRRAVNFVCGDRLATVVALEVGAGPVNLVLDVANVSFIRELEIAEGSVVLNGRGFPLVAERLYDSSLPDARCDRAVWDASLSVLRERLIESAPSKSLAFLFEESRRAGFRPGFEAEAAETLARGVAELAAGRLEEGARRLRGCGFGLTPGGDDFLAGMMIALNARGRMLGDGSAEAVGPIHAAAEGGEVLTRTMLGQAAAGRLTEPVKALITALPGADECLLRAAADRVMAQGATSGADWLSGFVWGAGVTGSLASPGS